MKRAVFALAATVLTLSGCYIDGAGMRVTPNDVKLDYLEHQLQLSTDKNVGGISVLTDGVPCPEVFNMGKSIVVYDGEWISVLFPLRSNKRNLYVLCNENRFSRPRRCEITVRNNVGFDTVVITQEGCPDPICTKDEECLEQSSQLSRK